MTLVCLQTGKFKATMFTMKIIKYHAVKLINVFENSVYDCVYGGVIPKSK